jgi:hypothetical protein
VVPNIESVWPHWQSWGLPSFVLKLSSNWILQQPTVDHKAVKRQHGSPVSSFGGEDFLP